jgi:hypothetical protein
MWGRDSAYDRYKEGLYSAVNSGGLRLALPATVGTYAEAFTTGFREKTITSPYEQVTWTIEALPLIETASFGFLCTHVASMLGILHGTGQLNNASVVSLFFLRYPDRREFNHMKAFVTACEQSDNVVVDYRIADKKIPHHWVKVMPTALSLCDYLRFERSVGRNLSEVRHVKAGNERSAQKAVNDVMRDFSQDWTRISRSAAGDYFF